MKILHVYRSMGQGGAQKIIFQLCKGNTDAVQFVASSGGVYEERLKSISVKHYSIPDIDNKNPFIILKVINILNKIVRNEKIDVVHSHHRMAAFYCRIISMLNPKVKHVYTAHNVFYGKKLLMRFALKKSKIVAVGNSVKNNLITEYSIPEEQITVIYNAIDLSENNANPNSEIEALKEKGFCVVGAIGRLSEQKGFDILIKAMAEVKNGNNKIKAVIIGDGEDKEKLQNLVNVLNLQNDVLFLGYQSSVLSIISQLDFVVLPSRWEGLPLTPIETFSQSKTIIATNIAGTNEIVEDNVNGLLFEVNNYQELSSKILLLYENESLIHRLEDKAYDTFIRKYDYSAFLKNYKCIYS